MSSDRHNFSIEGVWILFLGMTVELISSSIALSFKPHASISADGAPYYFMQQDFIIGVGTGVGLPLGVILSVITWRRFFLFSHMNLWMTVLWLGDETMKAVLIRARCPGLFSETGSPWASFEAYHEDWWLNHGLFIVNVILFLIILILPLIYRKKKKIPIFPMNPCEGKA